MWIVLANSFHSACPPPFTTQDGSCFYLSTEEVGWEAAKTRCEGIGGHLVMIKTAEQQQKVVTFLSGYSKKLTSLCNILSCYISFWTFFAPSISPKCTVFIHVLYNLTCHIFIDVLKINMEAMNSLVIVSKTGKQVNLQVLLYLLTWSPCLTLSNGKWRWTWLFPRSLPSLICLICLKSTLLSSLISPSIIIIQPFVCRVAYMQP